MVAVKIRIRRPSRFGIQAICIMSIWGVPDLSTRPRALRALGTRDKSDTPRIDMIQIERIIINTVTIIYNILWNRVTMCIGAIEID